ncbi:hypothetical protein [Jannaschia sp. M317]|uniref:hypothetical protein n=1 Tax=Jannaschia sp. M317 TaxID=2867011 RepID=UPI0021A26C18|nr:hypothetical protein [Jannaschia sp. M317]UWQ16130.1 hypothetical protein K3551_09265 [Jannaschia sp. M317]
MTNHPLRVLIGCETSGVVRRAFAARGHDAWSCDLLPAEDGSNRHYVEDVRDCIARGGWDLLAVMHPPCTRLCNSGVRWLTTPPPGRTLDEMWDDLRAGADLFNACWTADIPRVAVENPVMHKHARALIDGQPRPTQVVQPWWFGDPAFKGTGLYLRGLPPLTPTARLTPPTKGTDDHKQWSAIHRAPPGPDRGRIRSRTFPGIADAMADQWDGSAMEEAA